MEGPSLMKNILLWPGVIILFATIVITVGSREVATSPAQAVPLNSVPDVVAIGPAVSDVAFIDTSYAWAVDRTGGALYHTESGSLLRKQATDFEGRTVLS